MEDEIAQLRSLDLIGLQSRWQRVVGRPAVVGARRRQATAKDFGVTAHRQLIHSE